MSTKKRPANKPEPVQPEKANKLTEDQKLFVKTIIASCRVRKMTLVQIQAEIEKSELGVRLAVSTIYEYLKQVEEEWRQEYLEDINRLKMTDLANLDHMQAEAWSEWYRSKQNTETTTVEMMGVDEVSAVEKTRSGRRRFDDEQGDPRDTKLQVKTKETKKSVGQCADPRYMHNLIEIQSERAKLLGYYAPVKQDINLTPDKPITEMTDEELNEHLAKTRNLKRRNR